MSQEMSNTNVLSSRVDNMRVPVATEKSPFLNEGNIPNNPLPLVQNGKGKLLSPAVLPVGESGYKVQLTGSSDERDEVEDDLYESAKGGYDTFVDAVNRHRDQLQEYSTQQDAFDIFDIGESLRELDRD